MAVSKSVELDLKGLDEEAEDDSLFKSIRGYLIFGRIIGLLPYQGIFSKSSKNLKFRFVKTTYILLILQVFCNLNLNLNHCFPIQLAWSTFHYLISNLSNFNFQLYTGVTKISLCIQEQRLWNRSVHSQLTLQRLGNCDVNIFSSKILLPDSNQSECG